MSPSRRQSTGSKMNQVNPPSCVVSIASDACDAVRSRVLLPMWANSLSVCIEVNVIDDRADISLELTNTRVSRRAALMPQSRTNVTEPHLM